MLTHSSPHIYKSFCIRHLIGGLLIVLGINTLQVSAQIRKDKYERRWHDSTELVDRKINIIKTNIVSYLIGDINFTYERLAQNAPRSFIIKLDYYTSSSTDFDVSGVTFQPGIRYYLTKKRLPPAGYYVEPIFTYGEYTVHDKSVNAGAHLSEIGGAIIGGKQWAIGKRFTVDVFLGGGYVNVTTSNSHVRDVIQAFQFLIGASTGFRF